MSSDDSTNAELAVALGDARSAYTLGVALYAQGSAEALDAAERCWRRAAAEGHLDAQYNLGVLREAEDAREARRWWCQAADAGHVDSQYILGVHEHDRGRHRDAEWWWTRAARSGHLDALYNVGVYDFQRGQHASARRSWAAAGDAGHPDSLYALGTMVHYAEGAVGRERALGYWRRAAAAGHLVAKRVLDDLATRDAPNSSTSVDSQSD